MMLHKRVINPAALAAYALDSTTTTATSFDTNVDAGAITAAAALLT